MLISLLSAVEVTPTLSVSRSPGHLFLILLQCDTTRRMREFPAWQGQHPSVELFDHPHLPGYAVGNRASQPCTIALPEASPQSARAMLPAPSLRRMPSTRQRHGAPYAATPWLSPCIAPSVTGVASSPKVSLATAVMPLHDAVSEHVYPRWHPTWPRFLSCCSFSTSYWSCTGCALLRCIGMRTLRPYR